MYRALLPYCLVVMVAIVVVVILGSTNTSYSFDDIREDSKGIIDLNTYRLPLDYPESNSTSTRSHEFLHKYLRPEATKEKR